MQKRWSPANQAILSGCGMISGVHTHDAFEFLHELYDTIGIIQTPDP